MKYISFIMFNHCSVLGGSLYSQFLVMAFLPARVEILNKCPPFQCCPLMLSPSMESEDSLGSHGPRLPLEFCEHCPRTFLFLDITKNMRVIGFQMPTLSTTVLLMTQLLVFYTWCNKNSLWSISNDLKWCLSTSAHIAVIPLSLHLINILSDHPGLNFEEKEGQIRRLQSSVSLYF